MLKDSSKTLLTLFALMATQACASASLPSSDETNSGGSAGTSAPGTAGAANPSGGSAPGAAGSANAGSSAGGSPSATSGSASGEGGSSASAGSTSAVTSTPFGTVTTLLGKRCAGSKCHSNGAMQLAFANSTGSALHALLSSPIPSGTPHCVGVTLVTPNDTNSPLVQVVRSGGKIACTSPKSESVGPMPDKCTATTTSATDACLSVAEIKIITDWISAGAPQD